jgi:hypothetical protein
MPRRRAAAAKVKDAGFGNAVGCNSEDGHRDIVCLGRRVALVVDDAERVAFVRQAQHGAHEIASGRGIDPGGTQDNGALATLRSPASLDRP